MDSRVCRACVRAHVTMCSSVCENLMLSLSLLTSCVPLSWQCMCVNTEFDFLWLISLINGVTVALWDVRPCACISLRTHNPRASCCSISGGCAPIQYLSYICFYYRKMCLCFRLFQAELIELFINDKKGNLPFFAVERNISKRCNIWILIVKGQQCLNILNHNNNTFC